jgi:hypothetical protein
MKEDSDRAASCHARHRFKALTRSLPQQPGTNCPDASTISGGRSYVPEQWVYPDRCLLRTKRAPPVATASAIPRFERQERRPASLGDRGRSLGRVIQT